MNKALKALLELVAQLLAEAQREKNPQVRLEKVRCAHRMIKIFCSGDVS